MFLTVNGNRYVIVIVAGALMLDGQAVRARIDHRNKRILISDQVPRHERRLILFHEARHAHIAASGHATTDEQDADVFAEMATSITDEIAVQGGFTALESLNPQTQPNANQQSASMALREVECGHCGALIACGSLADSVPVWSETNRAHVMDRGALCAVCEKVTTWREICTEAGEPTGSILPFPKPRVLDSASAAQWLSENQVTARVRMI